jgi:hypothetical protein
VARPIKEGMSYFPHDVDASSDEKIEALRSLFDNDGYAFYFILLERIYRTSCGELDISSDIKKAAVIKKIGVPKEQFEKILDASFELGLFDKALFNSTGCLTSHGIKCRFSEIERLREKWRKKKEVFSRENNTENPVENSQETGERKEKKNKVNQSESILYTDIELEVLNFWNTQGIVEHDQTEEMQKSIKNALKKYGKGNIIAGIKNYSTVFHDQNYFYNHIFRLDKFLKQGNALPDFLEQGQQLLNYQNRAVKNNESVRDNGTKPESNSEYAKLLDGI